MRTIKSNQGFTLVELMVSLVVAGVVLAGICTTFYSQHTSYLDQEQIVSMQQNLRAAM
jgi:type IV pilus assembly protein PilW